MRYCMICKEKMYTSIESIWVDGINYDIHKNCKKKYLKELEDGE